jgi:hypothetical protein
MFGIYLTEQHELVIEIAVPGRGGEDLDVRVTEDEAVQINMPAKASIPGSLLSVSVCAPIEGLNTHWNVHEMKATCHEGLLTMTFPMRPEVWAQVSAEQLHRSMAEDAPSSPQQRPAPKINPNIFKNRLGGLI